MTAPVLELNHPDDEMLAAYVDDRASAETRQKVIEHMTVCADCREIVMLTTTVAAEETKVVRGGFGLKWIAPLAAAAAIGAVVFFVPEVRHRLLGVSPDAVVQAATRLEKRPTPGRIAGGFPYRELKGTFRGAAEPVAPVESEPLGDEFALKANLYEVLGENAESLRPNRHTEALATLLIAKDANELSAAVSLFEEALAKADTAERDRIRIDYTAALLARGKWNNDEVDLERALTISEDVWRRTKAAEALWNRAYALELLGREREARAAWQAYLAIDSTSPWAAEARSKLNTESELGALP